MTKNKFFIFFLLFFFFMCLSSVSAIENTTVVEENILSQDLIEDTVLGDDPDEIIVNNGNSIQSAIDNAEPGSTIIVESGTYEEDLVVSKALSIIGQNAVLKSNKTAFMILSNANNTSISGFNILIGNADGNGIHINSSDCRIIDNEISGGNTGILTDNYVSNNSGEIKFRVINNPVISGNNIHDISGSGISIHAFNPIVSRNNVTNVINNRKNGTAVGIKVNGVGLIPQDLKVSVTDNRISNVKSLYNDSCGLDVAGNCIFDSLVDFKVFNNTVQNVFAATEAHGMNIANFALNSTLPTIDVYDLTIRNISTGNNENGTVVGLSVAPTTIGQNETSRVTAHDCIIIGLYALGKNAKVIGIDATGVGCVDLYVLNNELKNFKASSSITGISSSGIEYSNFNAMVVISNNNITNLKSDMIRGINVVSLGNAKINKNIFQDHSSADTTFITGACLSIKFNGTNPFTNPQINSSDLNVTVDGNLTAVGNNIEGTGSETGFAVVRASTIHYNRAVNLKYNVVKESTRKFLLESYGYDPNMTNEELAYQLLKSMKENENRTEEELRNMSVELGAFLDDFFGDFDNLTAGDVNAKYNWWGTNSKPKDSKFKNNKGRVIYDPWLTLNVKSSPKVIKKGQLSKITADVYTDSSGTDHSLKASSFFSGPKVTLSTDEKGSFGGKKSITLNWTNGKATAYLKGVRQGLANVNATDYETANTTVLIVGKNHTSDGQSLSHKELAENVKTMPDCGNPILLLFMALILLVICRRK